MIKSIADMAAAVSAKSWRSGDRSIRRTRVRIDCGPFLQAVQLNSIAGTEGCKQFQWAGSHGVAPEALHARPDKPDLDRGTAAAELCDSLLKQINPLRVGVEVGDSVGNARQRRAKA